MQLPSWTEKISPVASDLALVAELVAAAQQTSAPSTFDVHVLRQQNPERLGGPMIRRPVDGTRTSPAELGGRRGNGSMFRAARIGSRSFISTAGLMCAAPFCRDEGSLPRWPQRSEDELLRSHIARPLRTLALRRSRTRSRRTRDYFSAASTRVEFDGRRLCRSAIPVAAMVALRDAGIPLPSAGVSISPWADLSLSGEFLAHQPQK